MSDDLQKATVSPAGEGRQVGAFGSRMSAQDTDGRFRLVEAEVPAGEGAPTNIETGEIATRFGLRFY